MSIHKIKPFFAIILFLSCLNACSPKKNKLINFNLERETQQKKYVENTIFNKNADSLFNLVNITNESNVAVFPGGNGDVVWQVLKKGSLVYSFSLDKPELNKLTLRFPTKLHPSLTILLTELSFLKLPDDRPSHGIIDISEINLDEFGIIQSLHQQLKQHGTLIVLNQKIDGNSSLKTKRFLQVIEENGYKPIVNYSLPNLGFFVFEAQNR